MQRNWAFDAAMQQRSGLVVFYNGSPFIAHFKYIPETEFRYIPTEYTTSQLGK